jgi:hypothetical protein
MPDHNIAFEASSLHARLCYNIGRLHPKCQAISFGKKGKLAHGDYKGLYQPQSTGQ